MGVEVAVGAVGGCCYLAASLLAVFSLRGSRPRSERAALLLMCAGALALAGVLALRGLRAGAIPAFGRFEGLTCYALALTAVYLVLMATRPARGIITLVLPYVLIVLACGFPAVSVAVGRPVPLQGALLAVHVIAAFSAYAVFTLISILALAYLVQDRNLKRKQLGTVWERLPCLETLDLLMSRLAGVAFLLLTVAVLVGFILVNRTGGGQEWFTDPKVGATLATWFLFGVLVHLRASADRHGRGVALVAVAGLVCLLFAFIGVHLVTDSVHAFLNIRAGTGAP